MTDLIQIIQTKSLDNFEALCCFLRPYSSILYSNFKFHSVSMTTNSRCSKLWLKNNMRIIYWTHDLNNYAKTIVVYRVRSPTVITFATKQRSRVKHGTTVRCWTDYFGAAVLFVLRKFFLSVLFIVVSFCLFCFTLRVVLWNIFVWVSPN